MRVESELVSVGRHREGAWAVRLSLLALWAGGIALFSGVGNLDSTGLFCMTPLGLLGGTSMLLSMRGGAFAGTARRLQPGTLTLEDGVLHVRLGGRSHTFPVADVVSGWRESEGLERVEETVLLLRDGTEVRVACFGHAVAEQLLREAGVAPDQRAVKIRVRPGVSAAHRGTSIFIAFVCGLLALVFGLVSLVALVGGSMLFFVIFGAFTAGLVYAVKRHAPALYATTLAIGTDGVVVERLFRRRLVRRAEIADVVFVPEALLLQLRAGETIRIPANLEAAKAVAKRIKDTFSAPTTPGASLDRLDRGDRPIPAWIAELRGRSGGVVGYRVAAFARDALLDLVKDGAAPAERRIGAALALSADDDPEARAALRVAADTCVDERLRVVLDQAGEMADEELEQAVAEATLVR